MSETVNTQLSGTAQSVFGQQDCSGPVLKVILFIIMLSLVFCLFSSMLATANEESIMYRHPRKNRCSGGIENFTNDQVSSFEHKASTNSKFTRTELLAPEGSEHLQFGEIKKYQYTKNEKDELRIEITANLYVLDGNVFDAPKTPIAQVYTAFLHNADGKKSFKLGDLKRDGDGLYKLTQTYSNVDELVLLQNISIVHVVGDKPTTILVGIF